MNLLEEIARFVSLPILSLFALGAVTTSRGESFKGSKEPPALPDQSYVANGCYLSAIAYIAALQQRHPGIEAHPMSVTLPGGKLHTIVGLRWESRLFLRDMYIGVALLGEDAQLSFATALAAWNARQGQHAYPERCPHSRAERKREVRLAAKLIAFATPKIIRVESPQGIVSVLYWRTPDGELGIYEPFLGTAVGRSSRPPSVVAQELLGAAHTTGIVELSALNKATSERR